MFKDKSILVIGGTGTIGSAAVKKLITHKPKVIRIFSRDEYKQFVMQDELRGLANVRFLLGDVRDRDRLYRAMQNIDIVFDFAALKHVPACEYNPFEAVKTNVLGTQNVIECSIDNKVKKVIYTSSDKAVSPTNTMGATKLLAERLIASADYTKGGKIPIFSAVRFGNVLGSRGSVVPLWQEQIRASRKITVTDPNMTRFMMSINEASELVFKACEQAKGGEVFVLKMPVIKLGDLASVVVDSESRKLDISRDDIKIASIGLRSGEKLFEELMSYHESLSAVEYPDMFAILPHHKMDMLDTWGTPKARPSEYSSHTETILTISEIVHMLSEAHVL